MKYFSAVIFLVALLSHPIAFSAEAPLASAEEQQIAAAKKIWDSLNRQDGKITLPNSVATLHVPKSFYYLNAKDAEKVLVEAWGNPVGAGKNTLGMLFPADSTPFDQGAWGVIIEYEEDGYVSDDDANDINYDELLSQMKVSTHENSRERQMYGNDSIELVGWASPPFYDKAAHKLHWAKEVKFGNQAINTLNYNIRILGRKGVLVLNFIAGMDQKAMVDANIDTVLALAEFDQGSRYEDFDPSVDKVAAYGLGALVAGTVLAKTGLLAAAVIFLKKFGIIIVIGIGALFMKLFRRKTA